MQDKTNKLSSLSDFSIRFQHLIDSKNLSMAELGRIAGISGQGVKDIIEGNSKSPRIDVFKNISDKLDVSLDWLVNGVGSIDNPSREGIPFYNDLAFAGWIDDSASAHSTPESLLHIPGFENASAALPVYGKSMTPHFNSGDIIVVKEVQSIQEWPWNKVALVVTNQGRYLKYLHQSRDGRTIILLSSNPETRPIEVPAEEVKRVFSVLGKVVRHEM